MYLEQFKRDSSGILKYLPYIIGFLGYMAFNLVASAFMGVDSKEIIERLVATIGKNMTLFRFLLPFALLLVLLFLWWRFIHNYSIKTLTTARPKVDWNRILFSFSLWAGFNLVAIGVMNWLRPEDFTLQFNWMPFLILLLIAVVLIPIQTSFEEYFFRGYFLQFLAFVSKNRGMALVLSSVIFGLMHLGNPEVGDMGGVIMIYYIGCGFLLGIMTLMDDGLELALGFHAANNLIGALIVTSDAAVFQTDAILLYTGKSTIWELLIQVFVIFPILLWIFSKQYGWTDWKRKLFKSL